jgi:hypothetical protein
LLELGRFFIFLILSIHALRGIRTHDPSVWAGEDSSCLRPRGHCDRLIYPMSNQYTLT